MSPDGTLAYSELIPGAGAEIRTVRITSDSGQLRAGDPQTFLKTPTVSSFPVFSPDGRWLAYANAEGGVYEVYVRAFPDSGRQWQVSNSGGVIPVWSRKGHELYYRTEDQRIMVASYTVNGDTFEVDKPRVWFEKPLGNIGLGVNYDVAPDGKRVVALMPPESAEPKETQSHVMVAVNFLDEVQRRVGGQVK
jgi:serine/threonine-protein kinase